MDYRRMDSQIAALLQEYNSEGTHRRRVFVPEPERLQHIGEQAERLMKELGDPSSEPNRPDTVLRSHFVDALSGLLGRLEDDKGYPFRYVYQATKGMSPYLETSPDSPEEKLDVLREQLDQYPALFRATAAATARAASDRHPMTEGTLTDTISLLQRMRARTAELWEGRVASEQMEKLSEAFSAAEAACEQAIEDVQGAQPVENPARGLSYREVLDRIFDVSVDELAERTRDDISDLQKEMERLAKDIAPGKSPDEILKGDMTPYKSGKEMLDALVEMMGVTQDLCAGILPLPEGEECRVEPVPPHLQSYFPWGGYSGPDALRGDRIGTCYVNEKNYATITRGWLMNLALHEGYPGHHTQYVGASANVLPTTAKITHLYSRASHALEGMAHRSEKKFQDIFEDPVFPLFVVYRQMHTAVRILCDLEINHFGNGVEAALELYARYMDFAPEVARGQARLQTMWRGYMTSYFTGHRQFDAIQGEVGMDDREFTRLIFTNGFMSVRTLGRLAKLTPEERNTLYADFAGEVRGNDV